MAGSLPDIEALTIDDLKGLVLQLLENVVALKAENAALREEIAPMKWVNIGFLWNNYDYKNHPSVDKEHKLIGAHAATDAAVHDSRMLEAVLVRDNAVSEVWADSSYRSRETEGWLKENGFFSRIHWRGKRGKPSSAHEQAVNRRRTRVRARVEHVFATQTNDMGSKFARTIGLVRATAKIDMMNPAYHRRRYVWLESRNGPPVPA